LAKYLVTGVGGFIGRSMPRSCWRAAKVCGGLTASLPDGERTWWDLEAMEFQKGELADPAACARACAGVEYGVSRGRAASVHPIGSRSGGNERKCVDANAECCWWRRACRRARIVFAGSSSCVWGYSRPCRSAKRCCRTRFRPMRRAKLRRSTTCAALLVCTGWRRWCFGTSRLGPYQDRASTIPACWQFFAEDAGREAPTDFMETAAEPGFHYIDDVDQRQSAGGGGPAEKVAGRMMNAAPEHVYASRDLRHSEGFADSKGNPVSSPRRGRAIFGILMPTSAWPGKLLAMSRR